MLLETEITIWLEKLIIKSNGKEALLHCSGCEGIPFDKSIVVDANSDSTDQAPTYCLDGKVCKLTLQGKKVTILRFECMECIFVIL